MSRFFCRDAYALLSQEPAAQDPPVVVLEYQAATFDPPPDDVLVDTVRQVCGAGWFRALANRLNVADLIDDVEQSTFLNVWRARATFDPAYPVVCRVARIGRNALIDAARSRGRRPTCSLYDDEGEQRHDPADHRTPGPVQEALGREMEGRLRAAVAQAPEQIRHILALLDQDMTFEQVAAALGKKKSAVVSAYHRWKVATLVALLGEAA
jgi:RNA polymerase sigma factor (sigma-70 family)